MGGQLVQGWRKDTGKQRRLGKPTGEHAPEYWSVKGRTPEPREQHDRVAREEAPLDGAQAEPQPVVQQLPPGHVAHAPARGVAAHDAEQQQRPR